MGEFIITVPFPPSINRLRTVARGRLITSKVYRDWTVLASSQARLQRPQRIAGHVSVHISLNIGSKRKYDIDNFAKALLDLIDKHLDLIDNDNLVDRLLIDRQGVPVGATIHVVSV